MGFVNIAKLATLAKAAYKGGHLTIGNVNGMYVMSDGFFVLAVEVNKAPKKLKAIIMELYGKMPAYDELILIGKDVPDTQMKESIITEAIRECNEADLDGYDVTALSLSDSNRTLTVLEGKSTGAKLTLNSKYIGLLNLGELDEGGGHPVGPAVSRQTGRTYYYNSSMTLMVVKAEVLDESNRSTLRFIGNSTLFGKEM